MRHLYRDLPCTLILFAGLALTSSLAQDKTLGLQPLVMLKEFNPWAMVVGSDSPTFVLYENGTVIYLKDSKYVSSKLTHAEVEAFVSELGRDGLTKLKDSYTISEWTDQPTNVLSVRTDGTSYKTISIYGNIQSLKAESAEPLRLPEDLTRALRRVLKYDSANSSVWMPEYIEVMIWPFEYAKGKAADWPAKWPGISDQRTIKHKNMYSIFIPESHHEELSEFIAQLKPTQAVRIDGKKWAISTRLPFPHELP